MSVVLSADGFGLRFFSSSFARMKASMGVRTQLLSFTDGRADFTTGWKAQYLRCASVNFFSVAVAGAASGPDRVTLASHSAPLSIQDFRTAISAEVSLPPSGISGCSCPATRLYNRLAAAFPP